MMLNLDCRIARTLSAAALSTALVILVALPAAAQNANVEALGLVRQGMDAYSNLDLDAAKASLDQAAALGSQLDSKTLARIYVSYGVLWSGGFSDNAKAQENFKIALCLDSTITVDPLFSSPEIDMMYSLSKSQASPATCPQALAAIAQPGAVPPPPGGGPGDFGLGTVMPPLLPAIPPCGMHDPLGSQKQKYELPFYVEIAPDIRGRLAKLTVFYAFDAAKEFKQLVLPPRGSGFGAMLSCDQGQIRIFDPASVTYYIEGKDVAGQVICGHGTADAPLDVAMLPDAEPLPSIAGMMAKECAPCPPWDESCGKTDIRPKLGEPCQPDIGCAEGLKCGDLGICEEGPKAPGSDLKGPKKFYVNVEAGVGFGYVNKEMSISRTDYNPYTDASGHNWGLPDPSDYIVETPGQVVPHQQNGGEGAIVTIDTTPAGMAFGGIPLRLAVGVFVIPKLSIELTGRFDVYVASVKKPKNCWEEFGESYIGLQQNQGSCRGNFNDVEMNNDEEAEQWGRHSPVVSSDGLSDAMVTEYQYAWLINARVRYEVYANKGLRVSPFLGIGYGYFQYRVEGGNEPYFPLAGMVAVELGIGLGYYFTDNVGILVELPIDAVFGDGFALNFDLAVGLGFGF